MGINSYDWSVLYRAAQKYLQNYDPDIRVDTGTQTFACSPLVDASFPSKGKKSLIEQLKKDPQIRMRRGCNVHGIRYTRIAIIFRQDGTLAPCPLETGSTAYS